MLGMIEPEAAGVDPADSRLATCLCVKVLQGDGPGAASHGVKLPLQRAFCCRLRRKATCAQRESRPVESAENLDAAERLGAMGLRP